MMDWKAFLPHLEELRDRLIRCGWVFLVAFIVGYAFSDSIFQFLVKPLTLLCEERGETRRLIYTGLTEAFMTYIKVGAFAALCVSLPYFASEVWKFVAPGLYQHEKRLFRCFLVSTPVLFILGAWFAYSQVLPAAYNFFLSFEAPAAAGSMAIQLEPRVYEYLSFVIHLTLAFGLCFELPILLILLMYAGIVSKEAMQKKWRTIIAIIMTVSAFITPPDLVSMVALALPLILFYGATLGLVHILDHYHRKKNHA